MYLINNDVNSHTTRAQFTLIWKTSECCTQNTELLNTRLVQYWNTTIDVLVV